MKLSTKRTLTLVLGVSFILSLAIGSIMVLAEEEVMVPLEEIKSSCYGEIDMTKSEFPLSEVGEECVDESWLDKNAPEKESQPKEKTTPEEASEEDYRVKPFPDNDKSAVNLSWNGYLSQSEENIFTVEIYDESYIHDRVIEGEKEATITFLVFHKDRSGWGKTIKNLPKEKFEGSGGFVEKTKLPVEKEEDKWVGQITINLEKSVQSISIWKSPNTSQNGHYGFRLEVIRRQGIKGDNFSKVVSRLNTPEKLVSYMEEKFTHFKQDPEVEDYQFKPYPPEEFFHREVGTCGNFAIFASYVLDQHGYDVELFYYRGVSSEGEPLPHTVTIFPDEDGKLNYITNVSKGPHETGFRIYGPFDNKDQVVESEKKRYPQPNIEVYLTATPIPGSIGEKLEPEAFHEAEEILDTPTKIGNYVARNFDFQIKRGPVQEPSKLFRSEKGNWYDFAIFISYLLERNNYDAELLRLDFTVDGEKWTGNKHIGENDLLVLYHDKDGRLRYINQQAEGSTRISQPFESLEAILEHEEKQRTLFPFTEGEIRIPRYALLEPGTTKLKPRNWTSRNEE